MPSRRAIATDIVRVCSRLYDRGLIAGPDGNVSARIGADVILATPAGASKVDIREQDLVSVRLDGRVITRSGSPSSELGMHLDVYRRRDDVHAVVHAHPPTATAFSVSGLDLMDDVLPEVILQMGRVPIVPFAMPGTPALAAALAPYWEEHDAVLLANHGATTIGPTLTIAHQRMESLEHAARILLAAHQLGRVRRLSRADVKALDDRRRHGR